jgi:MFS family permease
MGSMVLASVAVIIFGLGWTELTQITLVAGLAGFFTNAPIVGLYAIVAQAFPTELRGSATGFVIGIGRGGSALAPAIAGFLFAAKFDLLTVSVLLGLGSTVAAISLFTIRHRVAAAFA